MEIVNFNVQGEQYVCAAHVRNIYVLTTLFNDLARHPTTASSELEGFLNAAPDSRVATRLGLRISDIITTSQSLPLDIELPRGQATIPLTAIDIPFHSNLLRPGIAAFRKLLERRIKVEDFRPELMVGKWVPNIMGRLFSLDQEYVKAAAEVTGSDVLAGLLNEVTVC